MNVIIKFSWKKSKLLLNSVRFFWSTFQTVSTFKRLVEEVGLNEMLFFQMLRYTACLVSSPTVPTPSCLTRGRGSRSRWLRGWGAVGVQSCHLSDRRSSPCSCVTWTILVWLLHLLPRSVCLVVLIVFSVLHLFMFCLFVVAISLSVCLFVCLSVCQSVCMYVRSFCL